MGRKAIETRLIGGFLGAGKTTFILEQLKRAEGKVAVLVNEFGDIGIDGDLIRLKSGVEVLELRGGCICCSQQLGLFTTIRQIAEEIAPDLLLIEPSGVAEISELLQALSDPSLEGVIEVGSVVTVIDAETFLEYADPHAFGLFFLDQVRCADLILINKNELVSAAALAEIEALLALHNPEAVVVKTSYCMMEVGVRQARTRRKSLWKNPTPLRLDCLSLAPEQAVTEEWFSRLLTEMSRGRFGRIMRGKGFLNVAGRGWLNLQVVSGQVQVRHWPEMVTPRLILIGFGLRGEEIESFMQEC